MNLTEFAMNYSHGWAEHKPDAIAAMHTEDSVFHLHNIGAPAEGREAVRSMIAALLLDVPDLRFELKRAHFGTDHFVTEYMMIGTGEGMPFTVDGADVFTIRDGLVARKDSYIDWTSYEDQVGFDPVARFSALAG